eukprot:Skav219352  [mRNA]  locus=scaffold76:460757:461571:- [translate_table: standard]
MTELESSVGDLGHHLLEPEARRSPTLGGPPVPFKASRLFALVALIGTLGQLPMAYLNRFNLLVFFLRFLSYAYARFLQQPQCSPVGEIL